MTSLLRDPAKRRYYAPLALCLLLIVILMAIPTGFEGALQYREADRCAARVLAVDDSAIIDTGLVRSGEQTCTLELLGGRFKGQTATGVNMLNGSLEQDKIFAPGDKAMVVVSYQGDEILSVTMTDHYRLNKEVLLAAIFAVFLILFAGRTGVRAIVSFVMTVLMLWKVLVPLYLKGYNPIFMGLAVTLVLTLFIIALVYGFDRRCAAAVSGAFLGVLVTCVLGVIFTDLFQIHGAVMSYSESLLYAGFQDLSLTQYSGGYVALLMVFMAQGTPLYNILNYKYVASEIIHTVVGSFGLVTVAPLTALTSGFLLAGRKGTAEAGLTPPPRPDGAALRSESGQ